MAESLRRGRQPEPVQVSAGQIAVGLMYLMIALYGLAVVFFVSAGDYARAMYYSAAALINFSVLLMGPVK